IRNYAAGSGNHPWLRISAVRAAESFSSQAWRKCGVIRHLLFATLLCVLLFCVPDTQAQEQEWFHVRQGDYQTRFFLNGDMAVENTASLRTLLEKYLTIREAMQNPRMNKGEWRRLMQKTPQEVSDLLATEGYFKVSTTHA